MNCFAALAYQIGNGIVKARFSVFLTVPSFAWSNGKILWTETLEIVHRKPVYKSLDGPRQANLVLIAYASSEGSGEPAHPRSVARTFAAHSYKQ